MPESTPELQRLYFDVVKRVANPKAANGSPLVYQWRFTDADPWHLVIDNGSTRAEPGEAPNPTVTMEASWADFVATGKPEANPLKMVLHAPHPPPRHRSASWRGCARSSRAGQEIGGRASAQGRSASSWAASESRVASSPGRPMIWTASGMPSSAKPVGTDIAGLPRWFQGTQ